MKYIVFYENLKSSFEKREFYNLRYAKLFLNLLKFHGINAYMVEM